jgi:hypothetical protein
LAAASTVATNVASGVRNRFNVGPSLYTGGVAAEPGLDYYTMDVEGFDNPTALSVTDYCRDRASISERMTNLTDIEEFFEAARPKWAKVRWINVDGLNWRVIKMLAMRYKLHRLVIEDLLSVQRTKIDLYSDRKSRLHSGLIQIPTCACFSMF